MTVEQELKAALAVAPSPEFVAAVRMRIAREQAPAGPGFPMAWLAALLVTAVLLAAVDVARLNRSHDPHAVLASVQQVAAAQTSVPSAPQVIPRAVVRPVGRVPAGRSGEGPSYVTPPEVIVSPAGKEGLAALFVAMRDGRVNLAADIPGPALEPAETFVPVEMSGRETLVPPMTVQIVAAITDSEGVRW